MTAVLWKPSKPETGPGITVVLEQASEKLFKAGRILVVPTLLCDSIATD